MMETETRKLYSAFLPMKQMVTEVTISSDESGWTATGTSQDHTMAFRVAYPASLFTDYSPFPEGEITLPLDRFLSALKGSGNSAVERTDTGITVTSSGIRYRMPVIGDRGGAKAKFPELDMDTSVETQAERFRTFFSACDSKLTEVRLTVKDSVLTLSSMDMGTGVETDITEDSGDAIIMGGARAKYSVAPFIEFFRAVAPTEDVTLTFGTDYPVKVAYGEGYTCEWLLAPRIGEDDE